MEKFTYDIHPAKMVKLDFMDQTILIDPFINVENKELLISRYFDRLSNKDMDTISNYLVAEYALIGGLMELNTSVIIENIDVDDFVRSGLWDKVKNSIVNYDDFRKDIELVMNYTSLKNSTGYIMSEVIEQLKSLVGKVSEMDLSKEGVAKLMEALDVEKNEINKIIDPSKVKELEVKVAEPKKSRKKTEILQ
jgi:hypothetical protein